MPHDQCPMAMALKEGRPIRGAEAVAERPDGTMVSFVAYPTPLRDASGAVSGAVNMLVDIAHRKEAERRQSLLINELNHRVKNTLDTVLTFADGESVKKISIPLVLDDAPEGTEKFNLALSQPTGGAALGPQASVDVTLFDRNPDYPFWLLDDIGVAPPSSGQKVINVGVRLSGAAVAPITLTWNTADGSAHAGQDYVAASGQVQFAIGEKNKSVPVVITANGPLPADRTFYLRINGAIGQVIAADTEAEITIFGGDRIFANSFD